MNYWLEHKLFISFGNLTIDLEAFDKSPPKNLIYLLISPMNIPHIENKRKSHDRMKQSLKKEDTQSFRNESFFHSACTTGDAFCTVP